MTWSACNGRPPSRRIECVASEHGSLTSWKQGPRPGTMRSRAVRVSVTPSFATPGHIPARSVAIHGPAAREHGHDYASSFGTARPAVLHHDRHRVRKRRPASGPRAGEGRCRRDCAFPPLRRRRRAIPRRHRRTRAEGRPGRRGERPHTRPTSERRHRRLPRHVGRAEYQLYRVLSYHASSAHRRRARPHPADPRARSGRVLRTRLRGVVLCRLRGIQDGARCGPGRLPAASRARPRTRGRDQLVLPPERLCAVRPAVSRRASGVHPAGGATQRGARVRGAGARRCLDHSREPRLGYSIPARGSGGGGGTR